MDYSRKSELIANEMLNQIRSGVLSGQLPSDQKVAEIFRTSRVTAAKALSLLQERGVVVRIPRKGTFTTSSPSRCIRIQCNARFFDIFSGYASVHHPELEFSRVSSLEEKPDLIALATFSHFFHYEEIVVPFSRSRSERLRLSERFWPKLFDLHVRNGQIYGIPYLFSPILLSYNTKLMQEVESDFEAMELTFDHFLELLRIAEERGLLGLDPGSFLPTLFLWAAYNLDRKGDIGDNLLAALPYFKNIFGRDTQGTFEQGRTLFTLATRHVRYQSGFSDYAVSPLPVLNGRRNCPLASETLAATVFASDPEFMHELCEATLSVEFQKLITADRFGISCDRVVALESMESTGYRDDFFLSEMKHAVLPHEVYETDCLQEISLLIDDCHHGRVGYDKLVDEFIFLGKHLRRVAEVRQRFRKLNEQMNSLAVQ